MISHFISLVNTFYAKSINFAHFKSNSCKLYNSYIHILYILTNKNIIKIISFPAFKPIMQACLDKIQRKII